MSGYDRLPIDLPADHPAYPGHFPDMPVLPGVVLLDSALAAIRASGALPSGAFRIAQAKFFRFVSPGDPVELLHRTAGGGVDFEIVSRGERVAAGRFVPAAAPGRGAAEAAR
jgi:3-hydroxyacyl-[acyl-carrier-protein] dehydratase